MKLLIFTFILASFTWNVQAQITPSLKLSANFTALIVADIDSAINWYTKVLNYELVDRVDSKERGFKQSNLSRNDLKLELVELDRAMSPETVVPNYTSRTRLIGIFKTGYQVSNFDGWMQHLNKMNVTFYGDVVNDQSSNKRMIIILDPDGNRIQIFEQ